MAYTILNGNNIQVLKTFPDNHFDSIVTDPPYGISFLGKDWDTFRNNRVTKNSTVTNLGSGMRMTTSEENLNFQLWCEQWAQECFRVLKPGGYMLSFCAARMYHRMTVGLEDAGFEIRDQIMWIYSSGFPKSQDVGRQIQKKLGVKETKKNTSMRKGLYDNTLSEAQGKERVVHADYNDVQEVVPTDPEAKQWSGWGTQLKPAHEPIALARKPSRLTIAKNCEQWGVGALNIDATRVPFADNEDPAKFDPDDNLRDTQSQALYAGGWAGKKQKKSDVEIYLNNKRGPMERSTAQDGENIGMFDGGVGYKTIKREVDPAVDLPSGRFPSNVIGEIAEPYQKYFYCPKVGRKERHIGHETPPAMFGDVQGAYGPDGNRMAVGLDARTGPAGNNHPTVKPIELMKYLVRLVTPPGGHVLDPFNGSGSTGCAAVELDYDYTGIELDPAYVEIAQRRIAAWYATTHPLEATGLFE
jgi:site-specific DNA-methyltransferase (adenine-specific)